MPAESVIERLKRLEAEATNGEWTVAKDAQGSLGKEWKRIEGPQYPVVHARSFDRRLNGYTETYCGVQVRAADADLIVAMRNALPALLAVAEAGNRYAKWLEIDGIGGERQRADFLEAVRALRAGGERE